MTYRGGFFLDFSQRVCYNDGNNHFELWPFSNLAQSSELLLNLPIKVGKEVTIRKEEKGMDKILRNSPAEATICELLTAHLLVWIDRHRDIKTQADDYIINHYIPTAQRVATMLAPNSAMAQLAALTHEMGRIGQMFARGHFNDNIPYDSADHHDIGARNFIQEADRALLQTGEIHPDEFKASAQRGVIYQISQTALLHGQQHDQRLAKNFATLDPETARLVDITTKISEITNGTQSPRYFLYESQYDLRCARLGGSITDSFSTEVRPEIFRKLLYPEEAFPVEDCQTYAEYAIYQTWRTIRSLQNPHTHDITKQLLSEQTVVCCIPRPGTKHQMRAMRRCHNVIAAYAYIYNQLLDWQTSGRVRQILSDYYRHGNIDPAHFEQVSGN